MVNLILKWMNNKLFPISYKLWKENQDEIYIQLRDDLKIPWLSTQHTIHSGMNLPLLFLFITLFFILLDEPSSLGFSHFYVVLFYVVMFVIITFALFQTILLNNYYDRYTDEKFLELSKPPKNFS